LYAATSLAITIAATTTIAIEVSSSNSLHNYNMFTIMNPNRNPDNLHNILPTSFNRSLLVGMLSQ
jgi:hypothetical protein